MRQLYVKVKLLFFFVLVTIFQFSVAPTLYCQQRYALVIGNGNYSNVSKLKNPVNDASDMNETLKSLGFQVDLVLNGSLEIMENAIIRLENRLSSSKNSYGFFYYAGHGVQSNGNNYLLPVDADIKAEAFLRTKALNMQVVLDELNEAGNSLNIVVLDACRNNPFGWSRSTSRGLQVVSEQPADSIIVYATGAGEVAADGTGRNGLFTEKLLANLKTPGLDITDVFKRTGTEVAQASGNKQRPAIYSMFYGDVYFAGVPVKPALSPLTPTKVYHIGDTGPAGGIVFYDKGNNAGGWQYLEAAPASTDSTLQGFYADPAYANITDSSYGAGYSNTQLLLTELRKKGITGNTAPQICDSLVVNGYDDWYLPSLGELRMMYQNLLEKGKGSFVRTKYWSSTFFTDLSLTGLVTTNQGLVYKVDFSSGSEGMGYASNTDRVRACRRF
jgi:hypothetical protein